MQRTEGAAGILVHISHDNNVLTGHVVAIENRIEQRSKLTDFIQQFRRFIRVAQVQHPGASKQILKIERVDTHGARVIDVSR
ncbi:hypothetical protein [Nitrosospira sp. Is2]|uniref:hypothetical protein n=1 Tax=Nitrosospira sp. Is2 TaxID=3080532 RepID=UPI0029548BCC|nr:hypothetical protein [Nitrosospira sp. Is2]WON73777.1 hypothetical protein R5L00_15050 [Nitrosospira sp. Is2]